MTHGTLCSLCVFPCHQGSPKVSTGPAQGWQALHGCAHPRGVAVEKGRDQNPLTPLLSSPLTGQKEDLAFPFGPISCADIFLSSLSSSFSQWSFPKQKHLLRKKKAGSTTYLENKRQTERRFYRARSKGQNICCPQMTTHSRHLHPGEVMTLSGAVCRVLQLLGSL